MSCKRDRPHHEQVRQTWLRSCPVDYKFFLGSGQDSALIEDEIELPVADGYRNACKIKEIVKYALKLDYDYVFKCDIDTYVCVSRLVKSGFENYDWSGYNCSYGGSGYWLSKTAQRMLSECENCESRLEDHWVTEKLLNLGLKPYQDRRYHSLTKEGPEPLNDIITVHWYSEHDAIRKTDEHSKGVTYERTISTPERLSLIHEYHKKAEGAQ
jgi:hypothetical protein